MTTARAARATRRASRGQRRRTKPKRFKLVAGVSCKGTFERHVGEVGYNKGLAAFEKQVEAKLAERRASDDDGFIELRGDVQSLTWDATLSEAQRIDCLAACSTQESEEAAWASEPDTDAESEDESEAEWASEPDTDDESEAEWASEPDTDDESRFQSIGPS